MPLTPESRSAIFDAMKAVMEKFSPPMVISKNTSQAFELMGNKAVPYGSKKTMVPGMYFSSIFARKDMISFYFFPLYYHEKEYEKIIPHMIKYLKGKTCFNIKKIEQIDTKELHAMLKLGTAAWKKAGYMN